MSKKYLFTALKILIFLVVCGLVGYELYKSWDKIHEVELTPNYTLLALAGFCYAIAFMPAAAFWRYAMQTLGQQPGIYESFRAYYVGHLGKYVPGKAMVLIIRTGLVKSERTKITAAGASVFVETMTMMAVGGFVAASVLILWFRHHEHVVAHSAWLAWITLGFLCFTVLPILPPVFHFAAKKCRVELAGLRFRTLAVGWILNIPVWVMLGVSLWITVIGLGFGMKHESVITELSFCTLAISGSIVVGFASMLPGGFGSREYALWWLLMLFFTTHPIEGTDPNVIALIIPAVHRIISILSELTVSAMLAWNGKRIQGQSKQWTSTKNNS